MSRRGLIAGVVVVVAVALALTWILDPGVPGEGTSPDVASGPRATPFGWVSQLSVEAGDGIGGFQDGGALQARFADPYGLAIAPDGARLVADAGDSNRIRRIGTDGVVATIAGSVEGFADGPAAQAAFHTPSGLALDAAGTLYIADTGNHAIRTLSPDGQVRTLAGTGEAGDRDGPALQAQFHAPLGVAVDAAGNVYVADTYNDRIRVIGVDGQVRTLAGDARPGYRDGLGAQARFDTPAGIAVDADGTAWVADLRNDAVRRVATDGRVTTVYRTVPGSPGYALRRPLALAITHDGLLYVAEAAAGRVFQLLRDGRWQLLSGDTPAQRMSRPTGIAVDADGAVHVADAGAYRVHRVAPPDAALAAVPADDPRLALGPSPQAPLPDTGARWPLHPQDGWHEVVGTLGEVRGDYKGESRHHLHGGLDIRGDVGQTVLAIADAKVSSPTAAWGYGTGSEGLSVDTLAYIHMRVGRTAQGRLLDPRFILLSGEDGRPERIRVPRGTRFGVGDPLGTLNGMAHVHLSVGASGYERNAVALGFTGYADHVPPRIDSIALLDPLDAPLATAGGRVQVPRHLPGVQIVVDAWDQVDHNLPRRRLGLYSLGYQVLRADGTPLPGEETARMTIVFDRLPNDDATKVAYAPGSGITVHGAAVTRFKYLVSNTVRDGRYLQGLWDTAALAPGDYIVRISAQDYSGNAAIANRDLAVTILADAVR